MPPALGRLKGIHTDDPDNALMPQARKSADPVETAGPAKAQAGPAGTKPTWAEARLERADPAEAGSTEAEMFTRRR
ncbi:hypothetical protein Apa02nite_074890 [Actinoplanes palleronii]|uniref:Uncharacterized protein n=1 Tax=Actinoplanes palleronii TaxID=113570 RepID=A0ABQ4BM47_9ACTN|nr:hypothetical protein Apa02nite_074890 [Actinoplanes palleronii]